MNGNTGQKQHDGDNDIWHLSSAESDSNVLIYLVGKIEFSTHFEGIEFSNKNICLV